MEAAHSGSIGSQAGIGISSVISQPEDGVLVSSGMLLTPGMANGSGSPGYSAATRICNPCGGREIWAVAFGAHMADHEEPPREILVYKDGQEFVYS